jgi:hypothetical protein
MSFDVVMRDPVFKASFNRLRRFGLDEVVWQTLGGVATFLDRISMELHFANDDSVKESCQCGAAQASACCSSDVETKLLPLFAENDYVTMDILDKLNITLTASEKGPDKVLCGVRSKHAVAPASPSMAFVLNHGLYQKGMFEKIHSMDELCKLAKQ